MAMHEPQDHTKRPRAEAKDSFNSIRELLSQQHQQLGRTICEQLTSHKQEISKELGEVNARMETLEQRVTKIETLTPLGIGQAQPQQPAASSGSPNPAFPGSVSNSHGRVAWLNQKDLISLRRPNSFS